MKTFTFNRPLTALFLLPVVFLLTLEIQGLIKDFSIGVLILTLFTLLFLAPFIWMSFFRRLKIGPEKAEWITPRKHFKMPLEEVNHFGIIKFRSFRFIFFSTRDEQPFQRQDDHVISSEDTFVIQYRGKAWKLVREYIKAKRPELEQSTLTRR